MKRNKKLLIVAIPVLVVLCAIFFYEDVYLAVESRMESIREDQDLKMKMLKRYDYLRYQRPEFEKQLAELRERTKAQSARFVPGEPVSIASANLQALVKGIIIERRGALTSERIGKPEDLEKAPPQEQAAAAAAPPGKVQTLKKAARSAEPPRIQILSISIDATLPDISALSDILYSIETRTPDLVIKELDVRVRNFREPRDLLIKMDVIGLYEGK
jgi:hypothetical protein